MYTDLGVLILRVVIGGVVLPHGLMKLGWVGKGGSVAGLAGWFNTLGMRPGLIWAIVAVVAEAAGGLLTILGIGGPIGPGLLAADLLIVTLVAHWSQGFWVGGGKVGWEFPLPLAAGGLAIALIGNGAYSVDTLLGLTYPSELLPAWLGLMVVGGVLVLVSRAIFAPKPTGQKAA